MKVGEIINEMSFVWPTYESLSQFGPEFSTIKQDGLHIGDIQEYHVYNLDTHYSVFNGNNLIAFFVLKDNVVEVVYVYPEYRRQGLFSMILYFIKRSIGISKIILGSHQSVDMVNSIKKIHQMFKTSWEKDGVKVPYDPNTIDQYYSKSEPTGWKIILENDGDFSNVPKYFVPFDLSTWYFGIEG